MDRLSETERREVWLNVLEAMRNGEVTQFITGGPHMWTTVRRFPGNVYTVEAADKGKFFTASQALELLIRKAKAMGQMV